jgi:hypothetical protein
MGTGVHWRNIKEGENSKLAFALSVKLPIKLREQIHLRNAE